MDNESQKLSKGRIFNLKYLYGLSEQDYWQLLALQGGRCAICETDTPTSYGDPWCVDHDHATGAKRGTPRGLLCERCNRMLGGARDNLKTLLRAIKYLLNPPVEELRRRQKDSLQRVQH